MIAVGEAVGAYRLLERLGAGGMGEVFLALNRFSEGEEDVLRAIKIIRAELSSNQELVARFFREAVAASRIDHHGIVRVYDWGRDEPSGRAYIIMERITGHSLRRCLDQAGGRFGGEHRLVAAIAGQIADALQAAHAKNIVHRDLKPDNVLLAGAAEPDDPPQVKIVDFGIAKLEGMRQVGMPTRPGLVVGTPSYMSPEQCLGGGPVDHRADIYSLGCVAFEMLVGRPPFVRLGEGELMMAHVTEPAQPLSQLDPLVPRPLEELVGRMLAKSPEKRPQSMEEVASALEQLLDRPRARFGDLMAASAALCPQVTAVRPAEASTLLGVERPQAGDPASSTETGKGQAIR